MEYIRQKYLSEMVTMKTFNTLYKATCVLLSLLCMMPAIAIDNPDTPDLVGAFRLRALVFEKAANNASNNRASLLAYADYQTFLDKELNQAYSLLLTKLPPPQQAELKTAQGHWLAFRDAEFELIKHNWTRENFGSSAGISQGAYRCSLIENRVIQLLHYVKNY